MNRGLSPSAPAFYVYSSTAITILLFLGILTIWVPERWALSLFQAGVLGVGMAWAGRMLIQPYPIRFSAVTVPSAAVVLWALLQLGAGETVYRWATWNALLDWSVNLVLLLVAFHSLIHSQTRRRFLGAVLIFGFLLSVLSTIQMFTTDNIFWMFPSGYSTYVMGPFVNRNLYAAFMELILPLALVQTLQGGRPTLIFGFMASVIFASTVAGASRAGTVLMMVEVLAVFGIATAKGLLPPRRAAGMLAGFVCLTAVLVAIVGAGNLWTHFKAPDLFEGRQELVRSSIEMTRERPLWGSGLDTWSVIYPGHALYDDGQAVLHSHNDWVEWAAEGGFPLLLIFAGLALLTVRPAVRCIWGVGLLSVLAHCSVDYPLQQKPVLAGWFFVFLGAVAATNAGPRERAIQIRGRES